MAAKTLTIDGKQVSADESATILEAATERASTSRRSATWTASMTSAPAGCAWWKSTGMSKLLPACTTKVSEGMDIKTDSERLRKYRRMTLELLFAERNHVCAVCVANGHCELQTLAYSQGMDHVRYDYCFPKWEVDNTHPLFGMDHNRCILCTRCVRVCWHIEGAGTKNVSGRGGKPRIITDLNQPWGTSDTCTKCGKCVMSCPTGALFNKGSTVGEMERDRTKLEFIVTAREKKQWIADWYASSNETKQTGSRSAPQSGSAAVPAATCRSWTWTSSSSSWPARWTSSTARSWT